MAYHLRVFTASAQSTTFGQTHYAKSASPPRNDYFSDPSYFCALQKCQIFYDSGKYSWNGNFSINTWRSLTLRPADPIMSALLAYHGYRTPGSN